jgi:hypothetical protein
MNPRYIKRCDSVSSFSRIIPVDEIADTRVSDPHELNQRLAPNGIEATPWAASDMPQGTTFLALRLSPCTGAAAAEAAVRSLQTAHPVLLAHIHAASTSSPILAFPISSAPQPPSLPIHLRLTLTPSSSTSSTETRGRRPSRGLTATNRFFHLLMALVGNLLRCLRVKSEIKSVTPDTAFRFNSKDFVIFI